MTSIIKSIVSGLASAALGYVDTWLTREEKEKKDWLARSRKGKLKSNRETRKQQKRINRPERQSKPRAKSPSAWNSSASILLALLLFATGCSRTVYVEGRWPVLDPPERPVVPEEPAEWTERERILKDYALQLESLLQRYNESAIEHNIEHGYREPPNNEGTDDDDGSTGTNDGSG